MWLNWNGPEAAVYDVYWDTNTSGITNPSQGAGTSPTDPGITGQTTAQCRRALRPASIRRSGRQLQAIKNGLPI